MGRWGRWGGGAVGGAGPLTNFQLRSATNPNPITLTLSLAGDLDGLIRDKTLESIPEVEALIHLGSTGLRAAYTVAAEVRLALAVAPPGSALVAPPAAPPSPPPAAPA